MMTKLALFTYTYDKRAKMNHFIAAIGEHANVALDLVLQKICVHKQWQNAYLSKAQAENGMAAAYLSVKQDSHSSRQFAQHKSLIVHSRKSLAGFSQAYCASLECNNAPYECKTPAHLDLTPKQLAENLLSELSEKPAKTLSRINVDYSLLAHILSQNTYLLAVSPFNPQTLFYMAMPEQANTYVVSSNIELLLAFYPAKVSPEAIALWLSGRPNPHLCMYQNIHQVVPGTWLRITRNTINTQRFWDIDPNNTLHNDTNETLAEQLKQHIDSSVSAHLNDTQFNNAIFTQMSGGMDSTTVSAIAYEKLAQENEASSRLHTISHTYKNTQSCDETDNIDAMVARYSFAQSHFIELDKYTQMSFSELYPTHAQSPGMVLSPKYYEEAELMRQHGAKLLLTGNGGDEMFWGHSLAYYDRVKKGDTRVISEVIKGAKELHLPILRTLRNVFVQPFIKYDLLPFLKLANRFDQLKTSNYLPPWLSPKAKHLIEQAQANIHNVFAFPQAELTKYARYEGLFNTSTINSMRSYQAVFDEFDLHVEHPLFNTRIAEFSFAIPQHMHISGKYPKLLLRQAMDKHLPKLVCWNEQKTVFDQHFAKLVKENAVSLRLLLQHEALADSGLLDNKALLHSFDQLLNSAQGSLNVDLLYAILVQSWYQSHIEN